MGTLFYWCCSFGNPACVLGGGLVGEDAGAEREEEEGRGGWLSACLLFCAGFVKAGAMLRLVFSLHEEARDLALASLVAVASRNSPAPSLVSLISV